MDSIKTAELLKKIVVSLVLKNVEPAVLPWLRRLVAGLSSRRPGFCLTSSCGFVVGISAVTLGKG
jgi:hypothetical protein